MLRSDAYATYSKRPRLLGTAKPIPARRSYHLNAAKQPHASLQSLSCVMPLSSKPPPSTIIRCLVSSPAKVPADPACAASGWPLPNRCDKY